MQADQTRRSGEAVVVRVAGLPDARSEAVAEGQSSGRLQIVVGFQVVGFQCLRGFLDDLGARNSGGFNRRKGRALSGFFRRKTGFSWKTGQGQGALLLQAEAPEFFGGF